MEKDLSGRNFRHQRILAALDLAMGNPETVHPSAKRCFDPSSEEWDKYAGLDMFQVVRKGQLHVHSFTCFKKGCTCRFRFPRRRWNRTHVTAEHYIRTARNHPWVNPYSRWIMYILRSNHDLRFIGTGPAAYASIMYCVQYASKAPKEVLKMWKGLMSSLASRDC